LQRIQFLYTQKYFLLLSSMCTLNMHIWYKHDKFLPKLLFVGFSISLKFCTIFFFGRTLMYIVQRLNVYTTLRQCKCTACCTVQLITFHDWYNFSICWTFDRFDMNIIICSLVNSGNVIIGEPVFFCLCKVFWSNMQLIT